MLFVVFALFALFVLFIYNRSGGACAVIRGIAIAVAVAVADGSRTRPGAGAPAPLGQIGLRPWLACARSDGTVCTTCESCVTCECALLRVQRGLGLHKMFIGCSRDLLGLTIMGRGRSRSQASKAGSSEQVFTHIWIATTGAARIRRNNNDPLRIAGVGSIGEFQTVI